MDYQWVPCASCFKRLVPLVLGARLTLAAAPCPAWPADRQQGKTTSLSKIIAALMLGSPAGGNLVFVYSACPACPWFPGVPGVLPADPPQAPASTAPPK